MQVEIINPQGNVSYRRPHDHPDVMEALSTPGYSVRCAEPKGEPQVRISDGLEGLTDDFRKEVEEMDETELRRRVLNQVTHIQAYQKCLDGLGLKYATDGHRRPDDIREIVKALTGPSNVCMSHGGHK